MQQDLPDWRHSRADPDEVVSAEDQQAWYEGAGAFIAAGEDDRSSLIHLSSNSLLQTLISSATCPDWPSE